MADEMPNWLNAPEKLKQQSFKVLDKEAGKRAKGKDPREPIDWDGVNKAVISWWEGHGFSYP